MTQKSVEALRRLLGTARKAVRTAAAWAPLFAALLGGALPARAASSAQLNINVTIQGVGGITDLTAVPGVPIGSIALSWTEPFHLSGVAPYSYDIRVSTLAQISNNGQFLTASSLSAFSPSAIPAPGSGGGAAGMLVTGLTTDVTYYFAIREQDATTVTGAWVRTTTPARNVNNFSVPSSTKPASPAGGSFVAVYESSITANWTVSGGATDYVLVASTKSAVPPGPIAASSTTVASTATLTGLGPNTTYFLFVAACNSGCSAYTAIGSTVTAAAPASALAATGVSSTTVSLAWSAGSDPSGTRFRVDRSPDGVTYAPVGTTTSTAFTVNGLTAATAYFFEVVALNAAGTPSAPSNVLPATTLIPPPLAPAGSITAVSTASVSASWSLQAGATGYVLAASTAATLPPAVAGVSTTTAGAFAETGGLAPNTTYFVSVAACGFGCSPFAALGSTITLAAPDLSLARTSLSSSTVSLAWDSNGNPAATVQRVEISSDGVAFSSAVLTTGSGASLAGLTGGATYYFRVIAVNFAGLDAAPSNVLLVVTPTGPTPSAPSGLTASAGLLRAALTWNGLPLGQQGTGLLYYELFRSVNAGFGYIQVATTTATSYTDLPLAAGTTYFYKVAARDLALTEGPQSAAVPAVPYTITPMEPIGVRVGSSTNSVTFQWSPTARFFDGTPFVSTGTPSDDELLGYSVYRSTDICAPSYVRISTLPLTATGITDVTGGANYYYRLFAFNSLGASANTVTLSSLGERNFFVDDCASSVVLDDAQANSLNRATNGVEDIRLLPVRRPQDVGDGVYQSVEFRAFRNGATEIPGFTLSKPARVVLHFDANGGVPTPSTAPVPGGLARFAAQAAAAAPAGAAPSAATVNDLGMYWNNGVEFKKMYGRVDPLSQTVSVQSVNLGVYQVRALARSAGVVFDLSNVASRVITPNGDGLNDVWILTYDPGPQNVRPTGQVFDLRGGFVSDMAPGRNPNTLTWDGRSGGKSVTSGVYMYRVTGGGKTFTGTILVAK